MMGSSSEQGVAGSRRARPFQLGGRRASAGFISSTMAQVGEMAGKRKRVDNPPAVQAAAGDFQVVLGCRRGRSVGE